MAYAEFRMDFVLANALLNLREKINITRYVSSDIRGGRGDIAKQSDTVRVPLAGAMSDTAVSPGNTPFNPASISDDSVDIRLTEWRRADWVVDDKDRATSAFEDIMRARIDAATDSLARTLAGYLFKLAPYAQMGRFAGTVNLNTLAQVHVDLNSNNCPPGERYALLGNRAELNILKDDDFTEADKAGTASTRMNAVIGRVMGLNVVGNNQSVQVVENGLNTSKRVDGAGAKGDDTIGFDTTNRKIKRGDFFGKSGTTYTNYINGWAAASPEPGDGAIAGSADAKFSVFPDLPSAFANDSTPVAPTSVEQNLVIHKSAIALAMRPLSVDASSLGGGIYDTMTDPETGLSIRLEVTRQNKRTLYTLDWLYGAAMVRPECALLLGTNA